MPQSGLLTLLIKVAILLLLLWALYEQLVVGKRLDDVISELKGGVSMNGILLLFVCFILMIANWGIEAIKWKHLIDKLVLIRTIRSLKAVWSGVTLGLFTPNRIGEFGGRLLYIPVRHRIHGIVSSLIGSFAQIITTFGLGILGLVFYSKETMDVDGPLLITYLAIGFLLLIVLLLLYYNLPLSINLFSRRPFFRRILPYISVLNRYHNADYHKVLLYSIGRFLVFTAQYLILLRVYGIHLHVVEGLMVISVIFLAQTILPSFTVAELFTRGNISLFFLGSYTDNKGAILAASTSLWLINLIIPAVLGYFFILRKNFFKKSKNDQKDSSS